MSTKLKDRFLGAITVLLTSLIIFLTTSYARSFASQRDLDKVVGKIDKIILALCYINDDERICKLTKE